MSLSVVIARSRFDRLVPRTPRQGIDAVQIDQVRGLSKIELHHPEADCGLLRVALPRCRAPTATLMASPALVGA